MRLIGTAGHIDHGKSTLVQALTGVHPSRLPEERARGMTIDLGYAHLDHPAGYRLGIVDVPGHERLVKNMVAGATGFDLALWVVDARESVMPQSREHLHILELLGVRALIPVLTKIGVASAEQIETARRDVAALLAGRALPGRALPVLPLHAVDSITGAGIPELTQAIFAATGAGGAVDESGPPYLPIDRVFRVAGVGTVVTGTLVRGTLAEGDQVAIGTRPGTWRVRGLTNHHARVSRIGAGHRVGVNLAGLDADAVQRGDVLVAPDHPYRGRTPNVRLAWTAAAPREWKHGARLLFHTGCLEVECRAWGVTHDEQMPNGAASWAQLELPRDAVFFPGQRFILRGGHPLATLGGGEILDLAPDRPRRVTLAEQAAYARRTDGGRLTAYVDAADAADAAVLDLSALARRWIVALDTLRGEAEHTSTFRVVDAGASVLAWTLERERDALDRLRRLVDEGPTTERVVPYHRLARAAGVSAAHVQPLLRSLLDEAADDALPLRLDRAAAVVHPGRTDFTPAEQPVADALLARLHAEWLRPATIEAQRTTITADDGVFDRVVARLCETGRLVRLRAERGDLLLHADAAAELRELPARLGLDGVRAAEFCQALGVTRRHGVPYLEYLARERVLRRDGDRHRRV